MHKKCNLIQDTVLLHDLKRLDQIHKQFYKDKWRLLVGCLWLTSTKPLRSLDYIADYFGEQAGFYYAFLMHYTAWLFIPSVIGFIFFFGVLSAWRSSEESFFENQNTIHYSYYAIIVAIWSTCFIESWKRREALLGDRWLVRDSKQM